MKTKIFKKKKGLYLALILSLLFNIISVQAASYTGDDLDVKMPTKWFSSGSLEPGLYIWESDNTPSTITNVSQYAGTLNLKLAIGVTANYDENGNYAPTIMDPHLILFPVKYWKEGEGKQTVTAGGTANNKNPIISVHLDPGETLYVLRGLDMSTNANYIGNNYQDATITPTIDISFTREDGSSPSNPQIKALNWMRSSELAEDSYLVDVDSSEWNYDSALNNTPIKYFANATIQNAANTKAATGKENVLPLQEQLVDTQYIWDKGLFFDKYKNENNSEYITYDWASWEHFGISGTLEDKGQYSIKRFATYFDMDANELSNLENAIMAPMDELGNMSYLFPVNDSVFIFVNGQLAYWGGTDVIEGNNNHQALNRSVFMNQPGIALRNGVNELFKSIYPHTDGWCIDLEKNKTATDIKPLLKAGENRIDIFADDYWEGGGMNKLQLFLIDGTTVDPVDPDPVESYNIIYIANDGNDTYNDSWLDSRKAYVVKSDVETGISKSGYTFVGWNTQPDGSGLTYFSGDSILMTEDIILYAQWTYDAQAELAISMDVANSGNYTNYLPGEQYLYKITVKNVGEIAEEANVTLDFSDGLINYLNTESSEYTDFYNQNSKIVVWSLGSIDPGKSKDIILSCMVNPDLDNSYQGAQITKSADLFYGATMITSNPVTIQLASMSID